MTRPVGPPITWATESVYDAPGEVWDGTPTKVAPATSVLEQGWQPGEKPPAERMNWLDGRIASFATYQDAIEVQNWGPPAETTNATTNGQTAHQAGCDVRGKMYLGMGPDVVRSHHNRTWTAETLSPPDPIRAIVTNADDLAEAAPKLIVIGEDNSISTKTEGGAWTDTGGFDNDNDFERLYAGAWSRIPDAGGQWVLAGGVRLPADGGAWRGRIFRLSPTFSAVGLGAVVLAALPADYVVLAGAAYQGLTHIAQSPTRLLTCLGNYNNTGGSTGGVAFYWSEDGATWTVARATNILRDVLSLVWDEAGGRFLCCTSIGTIYSSADGVTWGLLATFSDLTSTEVNSFSVRGGVWVSLAEIASVTSIVWSVDDGASWTHVPFPTEGVSANVLSKVLQMGPRWLALSDSIDGSSPHYAVSSLVLK